VTRHRNFKYKRLVLVVAGIGFLVLLFFFCYGSYTIYANVKSVCVQAKQEFGGDCVESLIAYIKSERHTYREKNMAIWALGQLADKKALPFLEEIEKKTIKESYNLDSQISQHEVKRAIKWCTHGNLTKWMYRNRNNWK